RRWVRTVVFPEPAGACRSTERRGSVAFSRARSSSSMVLGAEIIAASVGNSTHAADVAVLARARLGIDEGVAREERFRKSLQPQQPLRTADLPRAAGVFGIR